MEGRNPPSAPSRPTGKKTAATAAGSGSAFTNVAAAVGSSSAPPNAGASSASWWPTGTSPSGADSPRWISPQGGFINLVQYPQFPLFTDHIDQKNFHFVGVLAHSPQLSPPPAPYAKGSPSPSDPSDKWTPLEKKKQKATSEKWQKA
uniref:Uncharacterized protein n=1 Tax=Arundo donax TaxID=35708 RepID=A0A0A9C8A8_ARUDO